MIKRTITIQGWTVDFLFADGRNDPEGVYSIVRSFDAPADILDDVERIMDGGPNCGFTFSNQYRRVCICWIGPQTEGRQWVNTTVHEIVHVAMAIARDKDIDPFSESMAYLIGNITEGISDILCFLSCDHCRERKND